MMRCCATAAAYQPYSSFSEAQGIVCKVVRRGHVEKAVIDARWQSCIRLSREQVGRGFQAVLVPVGFNDHLFKHIKCGGGSPAGFPAHHIGSPAAYHCSYPSCPPSTNSITSFL